jgi:S1/P1 Nuclease
MLSVGRWKFARGILVGRFCWIVFVFLTCWGGFLAPTADAWGCNGHLVTALIAEKYINPDAWAMISQIQDAAPISPDLPRYCKETVGDPFADSATWADDERSVNPSTGGWHFVDIPRGVTAGDLSQYCPNTTGCITKALAEQLALLRDRNTPAAKRADALRYVIHFVGDIHQPLHTTSNDDQGGNCVPVGFFGKVPTETNKQRESYQPNLHSIWDTGLLAQFAGERTTQQLADELNFKFRAQISAWQSGTLDPQAWAWEGHELAERVVYGFLPVKVEIEAPREVKSCADDDHIAQRMLDLNEKIGDEYEQAVAPVVQEQLTKAGVRLAAILNQLWP